MKPIFFTKMEATGNDFVLIDNREGMFKEFLRSNGAKEIIKKMLDRHFGIGGDGLIILEEAKGYPFSMKYFNCDGSEAVLCLNGARCAVDFAYRLGIINAKGKFLTPAGPIGFFHQSHAVSIEVNPPTEINLNLVIAIGQKKHKVHFLKLGVPHTVIFVDDYDEIDILKLGSAIRNHKTFAPEGTNVNFVRNDEKELFVRTYERGVEGETLSCGSGAVCSAYIAIKLFIVSSPVLVKTNGGELNVTVDDRLYLEGPVNFVCDGTYYL
uniref:Diaminopimelate epimerase n=1 Tax=candidate division WOR-3 bacterium TaxID=2052148 RepID=A0A7C4XLE8_UNCW3